MGSLKWSYYNFLMTINESDKFLYNAYTNNLLKLTDELFDILRAAEKTKSIELLYKTLSTNEIEYFIKTQVLIEDEDELIDKLHFNELTRRFSQKHLSITIAPTQKCNFNCTYCFEQFRDSDYMSKETENSIIDYIKTQKEKNGLESLSIGWYGGEPLLATGNIISLWNKIKTLNLKILDNFIVTNGYFFNTKNIEILKNVEIQEIQITLDGFKDIHDKRRPLFSGEGTFNKIIENLDNFFKNETNNSFRVNIRVNVDKTNSSDYIKIYKWIKDRYPQNNLIVYPGWIHIDTGLQSSCSLNKKEKQDLHIKLCKKHGVVTNRFFPNHVNIGCAAGYPNSMLIAPDGSIYKCWEELGNKNRIVGNINLPHKWTNQKMRVRYCVGIDHYQNPTCRRCRYLPICDGGCPLRRYENKYENKNNDCCTYFKGRLKDYLELHYKMKVSNLAE